MLLSVPDGAPVHLRAVPIALWCSDYTQGTFAEDRRQQQRFQPGFAAVTGAYVACIHTADGDESFAATSWTLRCGRTNDFGWVLQRDRAALGAEDQLSRSGWKRKESAPAGVRDPNAVPPDAGLPDYDGEVSDAEDAGVQPPLDLFMFHPDDAVMLELDTGDANAEAMFVLPNAQHHIFWCYDEQLFQLFLKAYDADPVGALRAYKVPVYEVAPFYCPAPVDALRELSPREQGFVARLLSSGMEGYHGGLPALDGMSAAIFDATPPLLRKLYLCEWLEWCCLHAVHDDPHWPYLLALRSVIRAAQNGAPIPDLAARMPGGAKGQCAGKMRLYLHALASCGLDQRLAVRAVVDVRSESRMHGPWSEVAEALRQKHDIPHPAVNVSDRTNFYFSETERDTLVAYFDMYALGYRHAADAEALDDHWHEIQRALAWLLQRQTRLLQSISEPLLMRTLGLCIPRREPERKAALADRYHYLCAAREVPFWKEAHARLATQSAWDAHKPFISWMADVGGRLGKLFENLLGEYVPKYRGLLAHSVEELAQYLYRYHLTLHGKAIEATLPMHDVVVRLEPDATRSRAVAKLFRAGKQTVLLEVELLTRVVRAPELEEHAPFGATDPGTQFKRFRRALDQGSVRVFQAREQTLRVPDQDAAALESFPRAIAACAALIKTGTVTYKLVDELRRKELRELDADIYLDVAQESMQALEPGVALLAPLFERAGGRSARTARLFVQGAKGVGKVGDLLDSVRNVVSGVTTLSTFLAPESADTDLARYLDRGEGLPALLETTKGVVQVAKGLGGLRALMMGAGTTVATMPVSVWLALGMVAVSMLDVLIYLDTGGASPVDKFEERVRQARSAQFAQRGERILMPHEEVPAPSSGSGRRQLASCLLTKKLGSINHVLKSARAGSS